MATIGANQQTERLIAESFLLASGGPVTVSGFDGYRAIGEWPRSGAYDCLMELMI